MAQEGGGVCGEWYQSINFNKLSCRQVSVFGPKGTPSREEHKTPVLVVLNKLVKTFEKKSNLKVLTDHSN
jgi:hypothetical protein